MSSEEVFLRSAIESGKRAGLSAITIARKRRLSQSILCESLSVFESILLAILAGGALLNPAQEPFTNLKFAVSSGVAIGAIALCCALWTGGTHFDRFASRLALFPGAVAAGMSAAIAAAVGGASPSYMLLCAAALFAGVYIVKIPTAIFKLWLESTGRLKRFVAVASEDVRHRTTVLEALRQRDDVEIVYAGTPGALEILRELISDNNLDEIVLAGSGANEDHIGVLTGLAATLVHISPEDWTNSRDLGIWLTARGLAGPWNMPAAIVRTLPLAGWGGIAKRCIDLAGALLLFPFLAPIMAACALAIKLDSAGPVFFMQERVGYRGRMFRMFKFRSMYDECADHTGEQLTRRGDPRVTRVGIWLRRWSLDELPQIFNVLRGDMSLVGPRPHPLGAKAGGVLYDILIPNFYSRYRMKPGITGLAQIKGLRGNTETEQHLFDRFASDLRYADEWAPLLDIGILVRTVLHLWKGTNAF